MIVLRNKNNILPLLEVINVTPALIIKIPIIPISWQRTLCSLTEDSLFFQIIKTLTVRRQPVR